MGEQAIVRDAELLTAAKRDPEEFGKLYDRYAVRAYGWARRALGEVDAFDLVAELFAQAWIGRRRFHDRVTGAQRAGCMASPATCSPLAVVAVGSS